MKRPEEELSDTCRLLHLFEANIGPFLLPWVVHRSEYDIPDSTCLREILVEVLVFFRVMNAMEPEFPFWRRKRNHSTPVSPVRDTVKRLFIGNTP
jgi:hypothetical protein